MSKTKTTHMPGSLQINYGSGGTEIHGPDSAEKFDGSHVIADMSTDWLSAEQADAYAILFVAAPDLLEAAEEIIKANKTGMGKSATALRIELLKDAIAKAKGQEK